MSEWIKELWAQEPRFAIPTPPRVWRQKSATEILSDVNRFHELMVERAMELDLSWMGVEHMNMMVHRGGAKTEMLHKLFMREMERQRVDAALKARWWRVIQGL